ncbi:hypothetical protein ACRAVF_06465 [Bradyrhizobium oligotrophicum S58]
MISDKAQVKHFAGYATLRDSSNQPTSRPQFQAIRCPCTHVGRSLKNHGHTQPDTEQPLAHPAFSLVLTTPAGRSMGKDKQIARGKPRRNTIAAPLRALTYLLICVVVVTLPASAPAADTSTSAAVEIRNRPTPGELELRAHGTVELATELIVEEQRNDGSFERETDLDRDALKLVSSCDQRPGTCVTIDERGLRPVPWNGMSCSAQCGRECDRNFPLRGRFRFVAISCDGATRFEGPVFEMPWPTRGSRRFGRD